jgi:hygromycin-B 7''-O-kinase
MSDGDTVMNNATLRQTLSTIHTFEDYETLKQQIEEDLAQEIIHKHTLPEASLTLFSEGTNIVFAYGDTHVIKIFPPFHQNQFESERLVLKHVHKKLSVKTPILEQEGEISGWPYLIISKLTGTLLEALWETMPYNNKTVIIRELGALIREVHALPTEGLEAIDCHWPQFLEKQIGQCEEQHRTKGLPTALVQQLSAYLDSTKQLPEIKAPVILTGEYTPMNFLVEQVNGLWHISGLIDFGDAMLGLPEYDLLGPGAFLIQGDKQLLREFLTAYGYLPEELTDTLSHQLMSLMLLHQYSNLNIQVRIPNWKEKVSSLKDLERLVWGF